jgi:hypothetical protein
MMSENGWPVILQMSSKNKKQTRYDIVQRLESITGTNLKHLIVESIIAKNLLLNSTNNSHNLPVKNTDEKNKKAADTIHDKRIDDKKLKLPKLPHSITMIDDKRINVKKCKLPRLSQTLMGDKSFCNGALEEVIIFSTKFIQLELRSCY